MALHPPPLHSPTNLHSPCATPFHPLPSQRLHFASTSLSLNVSLICYFSCLFFSLIIIFFVARMRKECVPPSPSPSVRPLQPPYYCLVPSRPGNNIFSLLHEFSVSCSIGFVILVQHSIFFVFKTCCIWLGFLWAYLSLQRNQPHYARVHC